MDVDKPEHCGSAAGGIEFEQPPHQSSVSSSSLSTSNSRNSYSRTKCDNSSNSDCSTSNSNEAALNVHVHFHTHLTNVEPNFHLSKSNCLTNHASSSTFTTPKSPEWTDIYGLLPSKSQTEQSIDHTCEVVEASRSSFVNLTAKNDHPVLSFPSFNPAKLRPIDFRLSLPLDGQKLCLNVATHAKDLRNIQGPVPPVRDNEDIAASSVCEDTAIMQHQYVPVWKHKQHTRLARKAKTAFYHVGCCKEQGEKKLMAAIRSGDKEKVSKLLNEGVKPNFGDNKKRTPLHFAVNKKEHRIAHLLLSMGSNPNATDILQNTALHLAVVSGDRDMVKLLVDNGANIFLKDVNGRTPLYLLKARLLMWKNDKNISVNRIKEELYAMYCILQNQAEKCQQSISSSMDDLCQRLGEISTREEADKVADAIIDKMTNLDI